MRKIYILLLYIGYGFVTFKYSESAQSALAQPNKKIDGRQTHCNYACERSNMSNTGGGGNNNNNSNNNNSSINSPNSDILNNNTNIINSPNSNNSLGGIRGLNVGGIGVGVGGINNINGTSSHRNDLIHNTLNSMSINSPNNTLNTNYSLNKNNHHNNNNNNLSSINPFSSNSLTLTNPLNNTTSRNNGLPGLSSFSSNPMDRLSHSNTNKGILSNQLSSYNQYSCMLYVYIYIYICLYLFIYNIYQQI